MDLCLMISSIEKWLANCPSGCGCGDRESAYVTKGGYLGAIGGVSRDRYSSGGGYNTSNYRVEGGFYDL